MKVVDVVLEVVDEAIVVDVVVDPLASVVDVVVSSGLLQH